MKRRKRTMENQKKIRESTGDLVFHRVPSKHYGGRGLVMLSSAMTPAATEKQSDAH